MIGHSAIQVGPTGWSAAEGIPQEDRGILRELARRLKALSERPQEEEKRRLWYDHNGLAETRPLIFCDPEHGWNEILPESVLRCRGKMARDWEMILRKEIFWGEEMRDDKVILGEFRIPHVCTMTGWGMEERKVQRDENGSYVWEAPLTDYGLMESLRFPEVDVDGAGTEALLACAEDLFGNILAIRLKSTWWWTLGMTWTLVRLRGLEPFLYDFYDHPDELHRLMSFLRDGHLALIDQLEAKGLLSTNGDGTYVGSGGFGWTRELPAADFAGVVRARDLWGFGESQETVSVSPEMFAEFVLPYQISVLERFGLNCYGCCEPLDRRWEHVARIPRLRRVSVSPWADVRTMSEKLGDRYIFSWKPAPARIAVPRPDWDEVRRDLRATIAATRGNRLEIIMKDNHTLGGSKANAVEWCRIAREEVLGA